MLQLPIPSAAVPTLPAEGRTSYAAVLIRVERPRFFVPWSRRHPHSPQPRPRVRALLVELQWGAAAARTSSSLPVLVEPPDVLRAGSLGRRSLIARAPGQITTASRTLSGGPSRQHLCHHCSCSVSRIEVYNRHHTRTSSTSRSPREPSLQRYPPRSPQNLFTWLSTGRERLFTPLPWRPAKRRRALRR
jgi:hypothetical protein